MNCYFLLKRLLFSFLLLNSLNGLCFASAQNAYDDITCIILGASGDLAKRDLIPALYQIFKENHGKKFAIIGAALPAMDAQEILESAKTFISNFDDESWQKFSALFKYVQLDFTRADDFVRLQAAIFDTEKSMGLSGNRLVYCSTSFHFFEIITHNLVQYQIIKQAQHSGLPWHRIVYEKPFGHDLQSAQKLENALQSLITDEQIYRIDHFLYTQALSNLFSLRNLNNLFVHSWDNTSIERVDVLFNETLSVATRGKLYDDLGVMLDVIQNHMFQMLAVAAAEIPEALNEKNIKQAKIDLLNNVQFIDGFWGQYDGYLQEKDVAPDSATETFASLKFVINNPRWQGVPFHFVAGKCLNKTEICIRIFFKPNEYSKSQSHCLTIWVAPEPGFELTLNHQRFEIDSESSPLNMIYTFDRKNSYSTETYKTIFQEIFKGNRAISVDFAEIAAAWKLTDHIKAQRLPLLTYQKGSAGPSL